jgi:glycosyltransferase involved in cell wall biosynthesis
MPLVSIIVPVYNTEDFIAATLESLLAQTHTDIEILCINDGSKDSSGTILEDFAKRDNRIKYFQQENSGPARARNVGLDNATGQYVMFCDSDDRYEPDMIAVMLDNITDLDVVMCNSFSAEERYAFPFPQGEYVINAAIRSNINVFLWNKLFRKDIIDHYNIRFPDGLKADDNLFVYQYLACAKTIACVDKKLYHYIVRNNSITQQYNSLNVKLNDVLDKIDIMGIFYNFLVERDLWEDNKESFLHIFDTELLFAWVSVGDAWTDTFFEHLKKATEKSKDHFTDHDIQKIISCVHNGDNTGAINMLDNLSSQKPYTKSRRRYLGYNNSSST